MPKSQYGVHLLAQVDYNPDAPTEPIDKFLHDIVSERRRRDSRAGGRAGAVTERKLSVIVLLTGQGANGKSTYISLVTHFSGWKISRQSVSGSHRDKFKAAELQGKLMNHADLRRRR